MRTEDIVRTIGNTKDTIGEPKTGRDEGKEQGEDKEEEERRSLKPRRVEKEEEERMTVAF